MKTLQDYIEALHSASTAVAQHVNHSISDLQGWIGADREGRQWVTEAKALLKDWGDASQAFVNNISQVPERPDPRHGALPLDILGALQRWTRLPKSDADERRNLSMGSFLTAVLENNLDGAITYADDKNIHHIPAIVMWLNNNAPHACWGTHAKVTAWRSMKEKP